MTDDDMFPVAKLVPVDQWRWNRYKISYWDKDPEEGGKEFCHRYLVATDCHVGGIAAEDRWPGPHCTWVVWDLITENVPQPRQIGSLYGRAIHADGWEDNTFKPDGSRF